MTDESTDIAILKQLVLVARYMTETGVRTYFLLLKIFMMVRLKLLRQHLQGLVDKSLDVTKLREFGSDGASVMTGTLNGVAVSLKWLCTVSSVD